MRLIDADALPRHKQLEAFGNGQYEDVEIVYGNDIDKAPTIENEPARRGRWLYTEAWPHRVYCSVCYRTYALKHWQIWEDGSLARAYCPNCGVRMDGEENEYVRR